MHDVIKDGVGILQIENVCVCVCQQFLFLKLYFCGERHCDDSNDGSQNYTSAQ